MITCGVRLSKKIKTKVIILTHKNLIFFSMLFTMMVEFLNYLTDTHFYIKRQFFCRKSQKEVGIL
jgi:hypothetical protein